MKRIKELNFYQKGVLLFLAVMTLIFAVIYSVTISREGFAYKDVILVPAQENGEIVYSGKIQGKQASFTVSADNTVVFRHGDKIYGPYTVREDSGAIPKDSEFRNSMKGVEVCKEEEILFRGGSVKYEGGLLLFHEDGSFENTLVMVTMANGVTLDENGNAVDEMEPSVSVILELTDNPEMVHKGHWFVWFLGVLICAVTAISILFADEIFRFHMSFRIQNPDQAEPSDMEMAGRYISWTLLPVMAVILWVMGIRIM